MMKGLADAMDVLGRVRTGEVSVSEFGYNGQPREDGYLVDTNSAKRLQLLIALQYDRRDEDEALLVELFRQEIMANAKDPDQNLSYGLGLNAYLVARFKKLAYVRLFVQANRCNAHTNIDLDIYYLISAGVAETYAFVKSHPNALDENHYDFFYQVLGESAESSYYTEEELVEWWQAKERVYPDTTKNLTLEEEMQLAIYLNDLDSLRERFERWKNKHREWPVILLRERSYYAGVLGDIREQIEIQEMLVEQQHLEWGLASELYTLSMLYLEYNQPVVAWDKLKECGKYADISSWKTQGWGEVVPNAALTLATRCYQTHPEIAREAFVFAAAEALELEDPYIKLLEKVRDCAVLMGDTAVRDHFQTLVDNKQKDA